MNPEGTQQRIRLPSGDREGRSLSALESGLMPGNPFLRHLRFVMMWIVLGRGGYGAIPCEPAHLGRIGHLERPQSKSMGVERRVDGHNPLYMPVAVRSQPAAPHLSDCTTRRSALHAPAPRHRMNELTAITTRGQPLRHRVRLNPGHGLHPNRHLRHPVVIDATRYQEVTRSSGRPSDRPSPHAAPESRWQRPQPPSGERRQWRTSPDRWQAHQTTAPP